MTSCHAETPARHWVHYSANRELKRGSMARRYWLYKNSIEGGPAGYYGHWRSMVFSKSKAQQWVEIEPPAPMKCIRS